MMDIPGPNFMHTVASFRKRGGLRLHQGLSSYLTLLGVKLDPAQELASAGLIVAAGEPTSSHGLERLLGQALCRGVHAPKCEVMSVNEKVRVRCALFISYRPEPTVFRCCQDASDASKYG
jgi:hypothetical protein